LAAHADLLVAMGYKEIEVGYPYASQTDFDFVRLIAETGIAPDDVTIVVFPSARRDLIERTVESVRGITNPVVIHMYTATAPVWRDVVLRHDKAALRELILEGGRDVVRLAGHLPNVRFEFSPEVFNLTEPDYVLDVCDAVTELCDATPDRPVILNLPATIEVATPNVYADQIEYMHKSIGRRDAVILSVHPHNDRGTGVACAELAVLAGAQRVQGCVFGNGERTGNVDIATLALNLHAQGIDPMIDFSDIDEIRRTVEYCNRIEIHPRHPYAGISSTPPSAAPTRTRSGRASPSTASGPRRLACPRANWTGGCPTRPPHPGTHRCQRRRSDGRAGLVPVRRCLPDRPGRARRGSRELRLAGPVRRLPGFGVLRVWAGRHHAGPGRQRC
jgi:2-isopropylmalate synthase